MENIDTIFGKKPSSKKSDFSNPDPDECNPQPKKESKVKKIFLSEVNLVRLNKKKKQKPSKTTQKVTDIPKQETKPLEQKPKKAKKVKEKNGRPFYQKVLIGTAKTAYVFIFVSLVLFSGAVYAYKNQFENRAYYGTRILGDEVGGKSKDQVENILEQKISDISLVFAIDGQTFNVKPEDAGVKFKAGDSAQKAVDKEKSAVWYEGYLGATNSILYKLTPKANASLIGSFSDNLAIDYTINDEQLAMFTQNLSDRFNVQSQNAGLVMSGTEVQVIPAVAGRKIVAESVKAQIADAIKSGQSSNIAIDVQKVDPNIIESETAEAIAAAKSILNLSVAYHYNGQNFRPDKNTVATWIIFNTVDSGGKQKLVPAVDSKNAYSYIYSLASKINIPAVNKKVTVTNGGAQTIDQEGKDGLAVDVDKASYNTAVALSSGKGVDMELPTYSVKAKTMVNNIVVANWEKYIDISISAQRMCAYLAGGNQQGCWPITSGRNGWNTPIGTFLIQRKAYVTSMPNPPSPYPLNNIHYVSYFTSQGHAIHEAWWRSSFGGQDYVWNGSHGCINASLSVAQWIYNWAPIGTPVITHY